MKYLLIILILLLLSGCGTSSTLNSQTSANYLSDSEQIEVQRLINEGHYFDSIVTSSDELDYTLDNTLYISLKNDELGYLRIQFDGTFDYALNFQEISFSYDDNKQQKTALLNSSFNQEDNQRVLSLQLTLNDNKQYNLYFNPEQPDLLFNTKDNSVSNLSESIRLEIITICKQQWVDCMEFDANTQLFAKQFSQIFLGPSFYSFTSLDKITNRMDDTTWLKPLNQSISFIQPTYYVSFNHDYLPEVNIESWNTNKLYNTLSFLFFMEESFDSNTTFSKEDIAGALLSINPDYICNGETCLSILNDYDLKYPYQGTDSNTRGILSETYLNTIIHDIFGSQQSFTIDETKLLDNGIVQSIEEKYYTGFYSNERPNIYNTSGVYISNYIIIDDLITIDLALYQPKVVYYCYQCYERFISYSLIGKNDEIIVLDSYQPLESLEDYIKDHLDQFDCWTIQLQQNDESNYYKIIYAKKN